MRQPDFSTAATRAQAPTQATPAVAANGANGAAGAGFDSVFRSVQSEVAEFISHGSDAAVAAAPAAATALSPEALAWLERSAPAAAASPDGAALDGLQRDFLASVRPWAEQAGQRLGVAPEIVAAHAALESGWGQRPLRQSDGGSSNNLFGLKAGGQWRGAVASALTTEYAHGAALKKTEQFRSYPDQASAFRDYAQVLLDNPRYRQALGAGADARAFADGLARGGYASDPVYADKLTRLARQLQAGAAVQSAD